MKPDSNKITKYNIIDIVNKWLDHHQSEHIITTSDNKTFVAGTCQTELRFFINNCLKQNLDYYDAIELAIKDNK